MRTGGRSSRWLDGGLDFGVFAIWGLMRILRHFSTWPFVVYRFMLGIVILVGVATGGSCNALATLGAISFWL